MKKINFDLSFIEEKKNTNSHEILKENRLEEKKQAKAMILNVIIILAILIGSCFWVIYIEEKNKKIESLTNTALQYKKRKDPLFDKVISELSILTNKDIITTTEHIDGLFNKERDEKIKKLVRKQIEDNLIEDTQKSEFISIYFDGNKDAFDKVFETEFLSQKSEILRGLVTLWKQEPSLFEYRQAKYLDTLFDGNIEEFNEQLDKILGAKQFTLVEQKLPRNGVIKNYTNAQAIAPFKITTRRYENQSEDNYYVKLIDHMTDEVAVTIFIRAGSIVEVNVPLGTYEMRYATGSKWYGDDGLFGYYTSYNKSNELLTFSKQGYYVSGHSLVLYKVANGNFSTQKINAKDF